MLYLIKALVKAFLYSYRFSFNITIKTVHYTCSIVILIFEQTWNIKFYRRLCQNLLITFLLYFWSIEYITFKDIKSFLMNIAFFLSYYIFFVFANVFSLVYYLVCIICKQIEALIYVFLLFFVDLFLSQKTYFYVLGLILLLIIIIYSLLTFIKYFPFAESF